MEEWREIPEFPQYEVSNHGQVRRGGRTLSPYPEKKDYLRVTLSVNGKRYKKLVHVLVARAFLGPCPDGHEVNHIDLDPTNNFSNNLEYLTPLENNRHSFTNGRSKKERKNM